MSKKYEIQFKIYGLEKKAAGISKGNLLKEMMHVLEHGGAITGCKSYNPEKVKVSDDILKLRNDEKAAHLMNKRYDEREREREPIRKILNENYIPFYENKTGIYVSVMVTSDGKQKRIQFGKFRVCEGSAWVMSNSELCGIKIYTPYHLGSVLGFDYVTKERMVEIINHLIDDNEIRFTTSEELAKLRMKNKGE